VPDISLRAEQLPQDEASLRTSTSLPISITKSDPSYAVFSALVQDIEICIQNAIQIVTYDAQNHTFTISDSPLAQVIMKNLSKIGTAASEVEAKAKAKGEKK
jgi:hypothetical protein